MERIVNVSTIDEEFEKSRVKSHTRSRKGKLERVKEFERKGKVTGIKIGKVLTTGELDRKGWKIDYSSGSNQHYIHKGKEMYYVEAISRVPKGGIGKVRASYKIIEGPKKW